MERKAPTDVIIPAGSGEKRRRLGGVARDKREERLVSLVYLVCLVCLVEPDRPNRPDRRDRPDQPDSGYMLQCDQRTETECRETYDREPPIGSSTEVAPVFIENRNGLHRREETRCP